MELRTPNVAIWIDYVFGRSRRIITYVERTLLQASHKSNGIVLGEELVDVHAGVPRIPDVVRELHAQPEIDGITHISSAERADRT
jgi:hypothetical protein